MFVLTYDVFFTFLPILITFFCYLNVYLILRKTYKNQMKNSQVDASRVLWYSAVQMICFMPAITVDLINTFIATDDPDPSDTGDSGDSAGTGDDTDTGGDTSMNAALFLVFVLHRSWGIFNALTYWFLRTRANNSRKAASFDSDSNSSKQTSFLIQNHEVL